jgi:transposase
MWLIFLVARYHVTGKYFYKHKPPSILNFYLFSKYHTIIMKLSIQKRWEIIFLHLHRLGPKLSIYAIARELQCSRDTVKIWILRYQETGDVQDEEGRGRKRKTSEREDLDIISMAKKQRTTTLANISTSMSKQGTNISLMTVKRRLNEQGLHKMKPLLKPLLQDTHRANRLKWAKTNRNTDWSKVIFTDETTISQFSIPKKVWKYRGEIIKAPTVKHSLKVHIYGCFSEKGFGNIYCFTNNLNGNLLYTIYKTTLLSSARYFFGKDSHNWILQEDNDPKHMSIKAQNWKEEHKINRISWPSQSPDLNPIENVWSVLKANISNYQPTSTKELMKIIQKEWKKLDKTFAENLVTSMKNRISHILSNKGDHILY